MGRRKKARGEGGKRKGAFPKRSGDPASILGRLTPLWAESWRADRVGACGATSLGPLRGPWPSPRGNEFELRGCLQHGRLDRRRVGSPRGECGRVRVGAELAVAGRAAWLWLRAVAPPPEPVSPSTAHLAGAARRPLSLGTRGRGAFCGSS